jgi:prevent-host-death family protein
LGQRPSAAWQRYNPDMAERIIHISEAEAASNFADLLARVRAGAEVVIESGTAPVAVLRPAEPHGRLLSESLRLARQHAQDMGYEPTLDPGFAADLEEIIKSRKPREISSWE